MAERRSSVGAVMIPQEEVEVPRPSLLDVVQDRLQKQGKMPTGPRSVPSRMLLLAKTDGTQTGKDAVASYWEGVLRECRGESERETGLLLVFPNCVLHMVEGTASLLMDVCRRLEAAAPDECHMRGVKVCASTEDVPSPAFLTWEACFVNEPPVEGAEAEDPETMVDAVSDVNLGLLRLGGVLKQMARAELDGALDNLRSAYPDLTPMTTLLGILATEGAPTLTEFLDIYDSAVDVDLESEKVWPLPPVIKF
mmetsp:Transcript_2170/g.7576  ORF Transcript_2170/g.7576 Transcript_2170/m.7576 type:complete len:252 (-) Transcript_2170:2771-3526(-)